MSGPHPQRFCSNGFGLAPGSALSELPRGWRAGAASGCYWAGKGCHVPEGQEEEARNARKERGREEAWEGSLWSKPSTPELCSCQLHSKWLEARCSLPQAHPVQCPPQAPGSRIRSRVGRGTTCWWARHQGAPRPPPTHCPVLALAERKPYTACVCGGQRHGLDCAPAS